MPSSFIRAKPLQALKLTAVIGALAFAFVGTVGVLPGQELTGLLYLAFFPMILAVVVGAEALLAGYRLAQADDPSDEDVEGSGCGDGYDRLDSANRGIPASGCDTLLRVRSGGAEYSVRVGQEMALSLEVLRSGITAGKPLG